LFLLARAVDAIAMAATAITEVAITVALFFRFIVLSFSVVLTSSKIRRMILSPHEFQGYLTFLTGFSQYCRLAQIPALEL
jgi:hypothetical protein